MIYKLRHHKHPDDPVRFRMIDLPQGGWAYMPADIHVRFPGNSDVARSRRHLLAYIQWDDTYLDFVPAHYRGFFKYALPHLHARTSNIHTALSYENFWLDTVRKGVSPHVYIHNVERAIDSGLLLTDYGRMKARQMVEQRKREVLLCPVHPEGESLESPATAVLVAAED
jgi:hypothetical protein